MLMVECTELVLFFKLETTESKWRRQRRVQRSVSTYMVSENSRGSKETEEGRAVHKLSFSIVLQSIQQQGSGGVLQGLMEHGSRRTGSQVCKKHAAP